MVWNVDSSKEFLVDSFLIEHDKDHVWDRDGLMKLMEHCELYNIQHYPIEDTYLMHDHTVLMTSLNMTHEAECYKLEITISEGSINENTWRLRYIDLDR
jgi:hypothetical protein